MKIYHLLEEKVLPYPRADQEPIVGLADGLIVLNEVTQAPPDFDADTQRLGKTQVVDVVAKTLTHGWDIINITDDELAARTRKTWMTSADFIAEFTLDELAAVQLSTNAIIAALRLILAAWSKPVWSDDPRIQLGLSTMVSENLITAERSAEILAK
jgi:hypothetical protein